jgi:hypothetical protein
MTGQQVSEFDVGIDVPYLKGNESTMVDIGCGGVGFRIVFELGDMLPVLPRPIASGDHYWALAY